MVAYGFLPFTLNSKVILFALEASQVLWIILLVFLLSEDDSKTTLQAFMGMNSYLVMIADIVKNLIQVTDLLYTEYPLNTLPLVVCMTIATDSWGVFQYRMK